jgi:hypothetical protein
LIRTAAWDQEVMTGAQKDAVYCLVYKLLCSTSQLVLEYLHAYEHGFSVGTTVTVSA